MKIFDGETQLAIPMWITVTDSAITTTTQTVQLNDRHGLLQVGNPVYHSRSFTCSGTLFAECAGDVEKMRSSLAASLTGKTLTVYRDDDDEISYRCVLIGDIRVTYYSGTEICRAFSIGFTLKALDPFGYGRAQTVTAPHGQRSFTIDVGGNEATLPRITIRNIPYIEGVVLECAGSYLEVNARLALSAADTLIFENGCLYQSGRDISTRLAKRAVINPIVFHAGSNTVMSHIPQAAVTFEFQGRYK